MYDGRFAMTMYTISYGAPGIFSPTQTPRISDIPEIGRATYQVSLHTSEVEVVQPSLHDLPSYIGYRASSDTPPQSLPSA
jgi:hypothetical protein